MRTLISLIISIIISSTCVYANAADTMVDINSRQLALSKHAMPIEDELIKSDSFPKIIPSYVKPNDPIVDELVVPYEKSGVTLKIWARKDAQGEQVIDDELVTSRFKTKFGGLRLLKKQPKCLIEDKFAQDTTFHRAKKVNIKNKYDFTKAQIPVNLKIVKNLSTKHKISEGDEILFKTLNEFEIDGEKFPKGTKVVGRIETISASDKMGTPANIVIDNFYLKNRPDICLYGHVSKTGANRSLWVYPLYQAGNIMFYVAGFAFVPIHGGHAKVLTNDTFTVYYEVN